MKKTLTTALLIVVSLSSLLFSTAPAFASNPTECPTYSPGPTECNTSSNSLKILKGQTLTAPTTEAYPAPSATPNTVNGVVPASVQPTPTPTTSVQESPANLADTGPSELMAVWAGLGATALAFGVATVVYVRRKAKA